MSTWQAHGVIRYLVKHYFWVCLLRVFLKEITIWMGLLCKADCTSQCGWVACNQSTEGLTSICLPDSLSWGISLPQPLDSDSDGNLHHWLYWFFKSLDSEWNYITDSVSSLPTADLVLLSLYKHVSQCLIANFLAFANTLQNRSHNAKYYGLNPNNSFMHIWTAVGLWKQCKEHINNEIH